MSNWLEQRDDGTYAFFIDGDLQFDSRDERIYHESIALPALSLVVTKKSVSRALIIGGGDGLTARELLKSSAVAHVDLVDYDPDVIELARTSFASLNDNSLYDARLHLHVEDAWQFVERREDPYDLIVVDLTVAHDSAGTRFHSVEWYGMLRRILCDNGVLTTNGASPSATPEAYFSIFNGIRAAGLHAVPYRVAVPSFTALGYGPDWGFLLGFNNSSMVNLLRDGLELVGERHALKDSAHLRKLFTFPWEVFEYQENGQPAGLGSDILLEYFFNSEEVRPISGRFWDALEADLESLAIPNTDRGGVLLPARIRSLLAGNSEHTFSTEPASHVDPAGLINQESFLLRQVLDLMPALHRYQTRRIIRDFLQDPGSFLESIDLIALVEELLRRAAELPEKIVAELKLLQERLSDWAGDQLSLFALGTRVTTILTVVVILGNMLYPDAVYGKGEGGGFHHGAGFSGRGFGMRAGHPDNWGHWNAWGGRWGRRGGWARPWHRWYGGGWGGWYGWSPGVGWNAPVPSYMNLNYNTVDEQGNQYPQRNYAYVREYGPTNGTTPPVTPPPSSTGQSAGSPSNDKGVYRLGPDTDILSDGKVVMQLTNGSYLLIRPERTEVVDQASGAPVMFLHSDPSLRWHLSNEIDRQQSRIEAAIQSREGALDSSNDLGFKQQEPDSQAELQHMRRVERLLDEAQGTLGDTGDTAPPPTKSPVEGGMEVFSGVWMTPDGNWLAIKRYDGSIAYMDGKNWYSDAGHTRLDDPYPDKFRSVVVSYLKNLTKEAGSTQARLNEDKQEVQQRLSSLNQDLQNLNPSGTPGTGADLVSGSSQRAEADLVSGGSQRAGADLVNYGSETVARPEAIRRTKLAIRRAQHRLGFLNKELQSIPQETAVANKLLPRLGASGGTM